MPAWRETSVKPTAADFGATLLVEHGDLMTTGSHHYDGSSDYYVSFVCSECGVMTDLENYDGPPPTKAGPGGR